MLNHDYKINNGRNLQFTKFSFIDFVLIDRRSLSGKRPKSASGKSSSCRFSFSAERNANTKATEYVTFGFSFEYCGFPPPLEKSEPHCLSAIRIFFKVFSPPLLEKALTNNSWRLCCSFINLTEWRQRRVTYQQLICYISTREKILGNIPWSERKTDYPDWRQNTEAWRRAKRQYENIRRQKKRHIDDGYQGGGCSSLQKGTENNSLKPTYDPVLHVVTQTTKKCSIRMYLWLEFWPFSG